jgi:glycine dehydrogenase
MTQRSTAGPAPSLGEFVARHVGPGANEIASMLAVLGVDSIDALLDETLPESIRDATLDLPAARSEPQVLAALSGFAAENAPRRSTPPPSRPASSCATSSRTRRGTRRTRRTSPRSARAVSKRCSTSRRP